MHAQHTAFSLFLSSQLCLFHHYYSTGYTQKHKRPSKTLEEILMLILLGRVHFFHDDPTHRVPACVGVSLLVRVPTTAGPNIERYVHSTLRDSWAVALNGGCTNDIPCTTRVNRRVNWQRALCTVECKEPSAAGSGWNNPHVSLIDNSEMGIAVLLDKWALLIDNLKSIYVDIALP